MSLDIGTYELIEPVELQGVQWTEESQALDIANWIEDHELSADGQIAMYDGDLSGACGPNGEDWGSLEIADANENIEVAPFDYVMLGVTGKFFVISPVKFEAVYRRTDNG